MREGGKLHDEYQVTTTQRHRDIMVTDRAALISHVLLPGLVTLQAALCAAQCSFRRALLYYSTLLHALHLVRPPLTNRTSAAAHGRIGSVSG